MIAIQVAQAAKRGTRQIVRIAFMFACLILGVVAGGCSPQVPGLGRAATNTPSWPPSNPRYMGPFAAPLYFAPSVSYEQALQIVTDLGLQPVVFCGLEADLRAGRVMTSTAWQPAGQRTAFLQEHWLIVNSTASAPPDWANRLSRNANVLGPRPENVLHCSGLPLATGSAASKPQVLLPPPAGAPAIYTRITFSSPEVTYDEALYAVSDLGMYLSDPCYEQQVVQQSRNGNPLPAWHPMGQEQAFAATHTLIVATADLSTPTTWQAQLRALPGVAAIQTPYAYHC